MTDRIPVLIHSADPRVGAELAAQLRPRSEVLVLDEDQAGHPAVSVVATEEVDHETLRALRDIRRSRCSPVVLVVEHFDGVILPAAVEAGAAEVLSRAEACPDVLVRAVVAAASGDTTFPHGPLGPTEADDGDAEHRRRAAEFDHDLAAHWPSGWAGPPPTLGFHRRPSEKGATHADQKRH